MITLAEDRELVPVQLVIALATAEVTRHLQAIAAKKPAICPANPATNWLRRLDQFSGRWPENCLSYFYGQFLMRGKSGLDFSKTIFQGLGVFFIFKTCR